MHKILGSTNNHVQIRSIAKPMNEIKIPMNEIKTRTTQHCPKDPNSSIKCPNSRKKKREIIVPVSRRSTVTRERDGERGRQRGFAESDGDPRCPDGDEGEGERR
jgi:hypothetical protein